VTRGYAGHVPRFEVFNLQAIRAALDHHNGDCPVPARAILLHPVDHGLLGWSELWGLPVLADQRVRIKHVRIDCEGAAWDVETELETMLAGVEFGRAIPRGRAAPSG
jgi:hypothetical protein